jgi:uncharacterized protein (DUF885 family)
VACVRLFLRPFFTIFYVHHQKRYHEAITDSSAGLLHLPWLMVRHIPSYLKSLRATASCQAPLTGDTQGHGIFYVTPGLDDLGVISAHCPYFSAHETYPGHHILDHLRIHHPNPIRRRSAPTLGLKEFHEILLDGGQLPFHLVEKRLEARKGKKD